MTTTPTRVTVVISSYSPQRWLSLTDGLKSVLAQQPPPDEVIVVVDTEEYHTLVQDNFGDSVRVIRNESRGINGARNTGVERATGEIIVFLDDDAVPRAGWLLGMVTPLGDERCVAVGGSPAPHYLADRPRWFPAEFDWVFGCKYDGLPESRSRIEHVIGTTMAMRRCDLLEIGGFHAPKLEDLDVSLRLTHRWPDKTILYEPDAVVDHEVPVNRMSWQYFWRRVFSENRAKVAVVRGVSGATLSAERRHVLVILPRALWSNLRSIARGDIGGALRIGASLIGLVMAISGFVVGTIQYYVHRKMTAAESI